MMALVMSLGPSASITFQVRKWPISASRMPTPLAITAANSASLMCSHSGIAQLLPMKPMAMPSRSTMNSQREPQPGLQHQCITHVLVHVHHVFHQPAAFGKRYLATVRHVAVGAVDHQLRAQPVAEDGDMHDQ